MQAFLENVENALNILLRKQFKENDEQPDQDNFPLFLLSYIKKTMRSQRLVQTWRNVPDFHTRVRLAPFWNH